jgi:subtilisin family serine protease
MKQCKLLKHATRWQCTFIAAVIVLSTIPSAWGGRIDPGLLKTLDSAASTDEHAVIVKLVDKVDFRSLKASLAKEERKMRVSRVVQALRDKATTSRVSIKNDLDAKEREGKIRKVKDLWIINGFALTASAQTIRELAVRNDVEEVIPDRIGILAQPAAALATGGPGWNLEMVGAPILWQLGYSGQGVVVANLDSGVDLDHPALTSKWRGGTNSWFDAFDAVDPFHPSTQPYDDYGHGTNTMGVMVAGNTTDNLVGVAPDATWIAAKIFDSQGLYTLSGIHSAFQWTLNPDGNPADAPHVVNCSWEISTAGNYDPVFAPDIELLTTAGIVVVFAAGNSGPFANTSVSPANNPGAFPVGATGDNDLVTTSSSRGPSAYDGSIYPAVGAPGSGIRTTDLTGGGNFPTSYTVVDGTSVAAPQVAGGFALLLSINPNLTVTELENGVKSAALDLGTTGPDNSYGSGRLDIIQAAKNLNLVPSHLPNGDADGDGTVTIKDALAVLQASVGLIPWSATLMYNGDVAPLVGNVPSPDRKITVADALLILRKAIGANPF